MNRPIFLDDHLINGWMAELEEPLAGPIPVNLIGRWRSELLDAVQEAREPVTYALTGRYAALDRYLGGVAAGIAAGLATSPASDGGDSDPVILAAGLLAGSAALTASPEIDRFEVAAGRAAAAAIVDSAANGAGLTAVITAAARAAGQVRARVLVTIALEALSRSVAPIRRNPAPQDRYEVSLLLEPVDLADGIDTVAVGRSLEGLCEKPQWIPDETGYRLSIFTTEPGTVIETVWSFGRVRYLSVNYLRD